MVEEALRKYTKALKLSDRVAIYANNTKASPFTTGIWKPMIVVPAELKSSDLALVILHELCHIKNGDNVYGFIRLFTLSLYWFNPFVYIMDYYIEKTTELYCDERVFALSGAIDKPSYCHLIVEMDGLCYENKTYTYSFSRCGRNVKERVLNIMKKNKSTKRSKVCSMVLAGSMVLFSSIPVLAYQSPQAMEIQSANHAPVDIQSNFVLEFQAESDTIDKIAFDKQFTDMNGQFYNADEYI